MSFNPDQLRGQPNNRGSWAANENGMPEVSLGAPSAGRVDVDDAERLRAAWIDTQESDAAARALPRGTWARIKHAYTAGREGAKAQYSDYRTLVVKPWNDIKDAESFIVDCEQELQNPPAGLTGQDLADYRTSIVTKQLFGRVKLASAQVTLSREAPARTLPLLGLIEHAPFIGGLTKFALGFQAKKAQRSIDALLTNPDVLRNPELKQYVDELVRPTDRIREDAATNRALTADRDRLNMHLWRAEKEAGAQASRADAAEAEIARLRQPANRKKRVQPGPAPRT